MSGELKSKFPMTVMVILTIIFIFSIRAGFNASVFKSPITESDTARISAMIREARSFETTAPRKSIVLYRQVLRDDNTPLQDKPRIYNSLGWAYLSTGVYDSSQYFFRRTIESTRDEEQTINSYRGLGQTFLRKAAYDSAHYFLDEALIRALQSSAFSQQAEIHNDQGNTYIEESNFLKAMAEYIASAKLYDSVLHNVKGYSTALFNIGNVESVMGNPQKALLYLKQGRQLAEENGYLKGIAYGHKLIARIYRKLGKPDSAILECNEALKNYLKTGDRQNASEVELNIGNIYYDKGEHHKALEHLNKASLHARAIQSKAELAYIYSSKGFNYYALGVFTNAISYFDSCRVLSKEVRNAYLLMDSYQILSAIEKDKGNYRAALDYSEKYTFLSDSLTKAENRTAVLEVQTKYETAVKQSQIELLKKDQRINRISTYALIAFIFFGVILAALLINRSKIRAKTARSLAEKEAELSRQQKELFEAELKAKQLKEEQLRLELDFKNRELTTYTLNLIQKNEVLEELRTAIEDLQSKNTGHTMNGILQKLKYSSHLDKEWEGFKHYFEQVHTGFFDALLNRYPDLSATELKLCALLKLNLETKEMASLLGISPESAKVSRSRLRKKLSLEADQNLAIFMAGIK